jgi:hypothetical protein
MYLEKYDLSGRVAVVTGGGRAIGLACVEALAEAGAKVVIADYDLAVAEEGRDAMRAKGYGPEVVPMDVTDSAAVTRVADEIAARYGRVDILVNNAGIARSETPAEEVTDEHWLNVVDVNLNGTFWCCRAFGRHMLAAGSGAIVNVGSMSGFIVNGASADPVSRRRVGEAGGARERGRADLYRHAAQRVRQVAAADVPGLARRHADEPDGRGRRGRIGGSVPRLRCGQSPDGQHRARRRRVYLLVTGASA